MLEQKENVQWTTKPQAQLRFSANGKGVKLNIHIAANVSFLNSFDNNASIIIGREEVGIQRAILFFSFLHQLGTVEIFLLIHTCTYVCFIYVSFTYVNITCAAADYSYYIGESNRYTINVIRIIYLYIAQFLSRFIYF